MSPTLGSNASATGNNAETTVLTSIKTYLTDTVYSNHKTWIAAGQPTDCVVKNFPYTSIYGSSASKTEFVLIYPSGKRTRIEVKWQASLGSVDEKFPYVLENALSWPEINTIIIAAGGGAKPHSIKWLSEEGPKRGTAAGRNIIVLTSLDAFTMWAAKEKKNWDKSLK